MPFDGTDFNSTIFQISQVSIPIIRPVQNPMIAIIDSMITLLAHKRCWQQGAMHAKGISPEGEQYDAYCMMGALRTSTRTDWYASRPVTLRNPNRSCEPEIIERLVVAIRRCTQSHFHLFHSHQGMEAIMRFNDDRNTTHSLVMCVLFEARAQLLTEQCITEDFASNPIARKEFCYAT